MDKYYFLTLIRIIKFRGNSVYLSADSYFHWLCWLLHQFFQRFFWLSHESLTSEESVGILHYLHCRITCLLNDKYGVRERVLKNDDYKMGQLYWIWKLGWSKFSWHQIYSSQGSVQVRTIDKGSHGEQYNESQWFDSNLKMKIMRAINCFL